MIEDEMARASRSKFRLLHPTPKTVVHYLGLYRSARFSDHLIGKWVLSNGMHGPLSGYVPSKFLYTVSNSGTGSGSGSDKKKSTTDSPTKGTPNRTDRTPTKVVRSSAMKLKLMQDVLSSRSSAHENDGYDVYDGYSPPMDTVSINSTTTSNTNSARRTRKSPSDETPGTGRIVVNKNSPNNRRNPGNGTTASQRDIDRRGLFEAECANKKQNHSNSNSNSNSNRNSPNRVSGDSNYSPIDKSRKVYSFNGTEEVEFSYKDEENNGVTVASVESLKQRMDHINLMNQSYDLKYASGGGGGGHALDSDNVSVGSHMTSGTRGKRNNANNNSNANGANANTNQPKFVSNNGRVGTNGTAGGTGNFESSFTQAAMSMAEVPQPYRLLSSSSSRSIKHSNQSSAASIGSNTHKRHSGGDDGGNGLSISGGRPPSATSTRPTSAGRARPGSSGTSNAASYAADTSNSRKKSGDTGRNEVQISPVHVATGINVVSDSAKNQLNRLQMQPNPNHSNHNNLTTHNNAQATIRLAYGSNPS